MTNKPIGYVVTNTKTGDQRTFKTSRKASDYMDRTDNAYGACITIRKAIWS